MFNYTDNPVWESVVPLIDTTDTAIGGLNSTSNIGTQKLADRTAYLYSISGRFENINQVTNLSSSSYTASVSDLDRNMLVALQITDAYFTINLPALTGVPSGMIATIRRFPISSVKPVTISPNLGVGDKIYDRYGNALTAIYLQDGDVVTLVNVASNAWLILDWQGNNYEVGDQAFAYTQKPGTLLRNGQIVNRADYPRLWAWVVANGLTVNEIVWGGLMGNFSTGNGTTNFRLPDDRGYFDRGIDMGRGVDADRNAATTQDEVANTQTDAMRSHNHNISFLTGTDVTGNTYITGKSATGATTQAMSTTSTGGSETRPVNVAKYPLIVY